MGNSHAPSKLRGCIVLCLVIFLVVVFHYYPNRVDSPEAIHFQPTQEQQVFYDAAYEAQQARYESIARRAAQMYHIKEGVADFVSRNHLAKAHVLEVGSGEGSLQDIVEDYTGLDISATAKLK